MTIIVLVTRTIYRVIYEIIEYGKVEQDSIFTQNHPFHLK